tara:strand:+ start:637 stop:1863 length:1227 start_codon:yes stop_codon:yes gene_type:complete
MGLEETQKSLAKLLNRRIQLEEKAHSDFVPCDKVFKIEPDMSGGKGLVELVTGPIPYRNARVIIIKMLDWIEANGYTSDRASIHLNMSFQTEYLEDPIMVSKMNVLKFILEFDEQQVYNFFPERENSTYAKSIKWVMPARDAYWYDDSHISPMNFKFADSKYYGINFSKAEKNYLEFRYIGGEHYHRKKDEILYLSERFIMQMWKSCNDPRFTPQNRIELKKILNKNMPLIESLKDYKKLNEYFPNIHILVDLQDNDQVLKVQWPRIKDRVIDLIANGTMEKGLINYDSDFGTIQVKDGVFPAVYLLEGYEFIDCDLRGNIENSEIYGGTVDGSMLKRCNLYSSCEIKDSKVESCYVNGSVTATNCFVFGRDGIFKGRMIGGIYREGFLGKDARIDKATEVVVSKKIN